MGHTKVLVFAQPSGPLACCYPCASHAGRNAATKAAMTVALVEKYEELWEDAKAAEGCRRCLIGQLLHKCAP